jgi:hypothetical protein
MLQALSTAVSVCNFNTFQAQIIMKGRVLPGDNFLNNKVTEVKAQEIFPYIPQSLLFRSIFLHFLLSCYEIIVFLSLSLRLILFPSFLSSYFAPQYVLILLLPLIVSLLVPILLPPSIYPLSIYCSSIPPNHLFIFFFPFFSICSSSF